MLGILEKKKTVLFPYSYSEEERNANKSYSFGILTQITNYVTKYLGIRGIQYRGKLIPSIVSIYPSWIEDDLRSIIHLRTFALRTMLFCPLTFSNCFYFVWGCV